MRLFLFYCKNALIACCWISIFVRRMWVFLLKAKIIYTATAHIQYWLCVTMLPYIVKKRCDDCHCCRQNLMVSFVIQTQECFALSYFILLNKRGKLCPHLCLLNLSLSWKGVSWVIFWICLITDFRVKTLKYLSNS